jgi:PAS domain S-box-containing protein
LRAGVASIFALSGDELVRLPPAACRMPFTVLSDNPLPAESRVCTARGICRWVQGIATGVALVLGGSNLAIWLHGSVPEMAWWPGMMVMRMNTSLCIVAAALSLACWSGEPGSVRRWVAQGLGGFVALIGMLTAIQDIAGVNVGIDLLFAPGTIRGDLAAPFVRHAGRMSLNAALALALLGLALVGLDWSVKVRGHRVWVAPGLAVLAALPATLGLVGYLLGVEKFTGILSSTNILLHAAATLFLLSLGVLAARPERAPVRRVFSAGADGLFLRWTLPGSAALLLALGWAIGRGRTAGFVGPGEGAATMLYGGLVLLFALLFAASRSVARQEAEARRAATAFRQGQERSRAIIDTALDGVLLMDAAGLVVDWNPAAERMFGWTRAEVLGEPLAELIIPPGLRAAHYRGLEHLKKTGEGPVFGKRLELPALRRDGSQFPVELSINPLPDSGRAIFVGFIRDITQRQADEEKLRSAKEAAEAASRAKDNFVAALSHELRTPLTPVLLSAAALRDDARLPADVRTEMAMMERNIALEARLIDDLLDLTRITRGKLPLRTEPCEAHSLLSHAIDTIREDARAKDIALELELAAQHSSLTGDPARLQQVFWNLLKNAVKFTPAGGRIAIRTRDDAAHERLIVEVADTGHGFAPEEADRIFEPFEQAGGERDRRAGGLGLGLAIARAIVDLHGGVIRAGSPGEGRGATFTVELPGAMAPPDGTCGEAHEETPGGGPSAPRRILLVEDHEPTITVLTRLLRRAGHEVTAASSVAAALEVAGRVEFDVLISDLGLPDGTGVELIGELRARRPQFQAIALSGFGMDEDLIRTRAAGFDEHLVKPVDFDQLRSALAKLAVAS